MKVKFSKKCENRFQKVLDQEIHKIQVPVSVQKIKSFYAPLITYTVILVYDFETNQLSSTVEKKINKINYSLLKSFIKYFFEKDRYQFHLSIDRYTKILSKIDQQYKLESKQIFKKIPLTDYIQITQDKIINKTVETKNKRNGQKESYLCYWYGKKFGIVYNHKSKLLIIKNGGATTEDLILKVLRDSKLFKIHVPESFEGIHPEFETDKVSISRPTKYKSIYKIDITIDECLKIVNILNGYIKPLKASKQFDIIEVDCLSDYFKF